MDIFEFIEKLQKKPEASRKRILVVTVCVITGIIITVWLTTLSLGPAIEEAKNAGKPIDNIKESFKDFYGFFKNATTK